MIKINNLPEIRCYKCKKLFFKGTISDGCMEIVCRGCKATGYYGNGISFARAVEHDSVDMNSNNIIKL